MADKKVLTVKLAAPDLRFASLKTGYDYYPKGSSIDVSYSVKNVGNLGVKGSDSYLNFYDDDTNTYLGGFSIPFDRLEPGQTSSVFSRTTGIAMPDKAEFHLRVELTP